MTTIERLAAWPANLRLGDIPPRVREKARGQLASVLGASFGGLEDPGARRVLAMTRASGGAGEARVLAGGFRTARPAAVLANAAVSCTFDSDEILLLGHPGHSAVTVPSVQGDTWEWDGAAWQQLTFSTPGPPGVFGPQMAYDAARDQVVLFGGSTSSGDSAQTWVLTWQ
jgi:hypothetical protein